jgi:hypothetical protein
MHVCPVDAMVLLYKNSQVERRVSIFYPASKII